MPIPACFHLADDVFPRVRAEAARRLVARGWSQSRTAGAIGVSQAMVSKYQGRDVEEDPLVLRLTDELLGELEDPTVRAGPSSWCATLNVDGARGDGALEDLLAAERLLLDGEPGPVMPQVGLNLARALPDAAGPEEVLAYPARIVWAGDRVLRPAPPALGGSTHLARCLLALRDRDPSLLALANVRGGDDVARALADAGADGASAPAPALVGLTGDGDRTELFLAAVDGLPDGAPVPLLVHDPGAVGIEPCLYVAGRSATDVARAVLDLAHKVNP